jgi:hypothetical protein
MMENLILAFLFRGGGIVLAWAGLYLLTETAKNIPELMYLFTPIFGTIGLVLGVFAVLWDGWKL